MLLWLENKPKPSVLHHRAQKFEAFVFIPNGTVRLFYGLALPFKLTVWTWKINLTVESKIFFLSLFLNSFFMALLQDELAGMFPLVLKCFHLWTMHTKFVKNAIKTHSRLIGVKNSLFKVIFDVFPLYFIKRHKCSRSFNRQIQSIE